MNAPASPASDSGISRTEKIWQSGLLLTIATFVAGLGNYAFQAIISRNLSSSGEFGLANSTLGFTTFLSLPITIASFALTHHIARFDSAGDAPRLHNLLAGCRRFLFRLTIAGSIFAMLLIKPLSQFFHIPRESLLLAVLCSVWANLWGSFGTTLCQGLGWFKRLALIGLLTMCLRVLFGGVLTRYFPNAEIVVLATAVGMAANLILLSWRSELSRSSEHPESPWTREFIQYLIVAAACVSGSYFFTQGDLLVAKRYFSGGDLDSFTAAGLLARALPLTVGPMLTVLFTHRSGNNGKGAFSEHIKLFGLYAAGLIVGAVALCILRFLLLKIIARNNPSTASMIPPFALTMIFAGLLQALALWALASRWVKTSIFYGILGLVYWGGLLVFGRSPDRILKLMPILAAIAFLLLFSIWLLASKASVQKEQRTTSKDETHGNLRG